MSEEYVFDENKSFRDLVKRSRDVGDGWRKIADALWAFVQAQAAKQPGVFEIDVVNKRIRFAPYQ